MGVIPCGFNSVWVKSRVGAIQCGCHSVWVQSCVGAIPMGAIGCGCNRVWVQSREGAILLGAIPMGAIPFRWNTVGAVPWVQSRIPICQKCVQDSVGTSNFQIRLKMAMIHKMST